jgi:hypothetical protein
MTIKEIKIGKQIWMTENLSIDTFANGDSIPEAETQGFGLSVRCLKLK